MKNNASTNQLPKDRIAGLTYWVYIVQNNITHVRQVCYSICSSRKVEHLAPSQTLVYYRYFDRVDDALGHKLLLESLSYQSLTCVIENANVH
ncbi:hypothetical protein D0T50_12515 [Bacteroides sp. 214]|uniref:hypothetical protein n=1 Tax=Bacteroides sp. 214 TaxID=2302935 RepID=UPI0013CFB65F|nr:hypothetical protein [Bacteroides sp. 214]NDW13707.1 hypothetical protein [Bacteroides sp. 214]